MNLDQIKSQIKAQNQPRPANVDPANPQPEVTPPLTDQEAYQLAGAFARLQELRDTPEGVIILNTNGQASTSDDAPKLSREAEIEALVEYLAQGLFVHASELLGAYFAMKAEYIPLCNALVPVLRHAQARKAHQEAQISKAAQVAAAHAETSKE